MNSKFLFSISTQGKAASLPNLSNNNEKESNDN